MITNAMRLSILKSIPSSVSEAERERVFLEKIRELQKSLEESQPVPLPSTATVTIQPKPCGSCGGGKVR